MVKRVCITEWVEPCGDIILKANGIYYPFFKATIESWKQEGEFDSCLRDVAKGLMLGKVPKHFLNKAIRFTGKKYYVNVGEQHA